MITEEQNIIHVGPRQITYWGPNDMFYADNLVEAYKAEPCTKEEFDKAVAATMERINSALNPSQKGDVLNTMQTDPNLKSEQEANQEATEQAAGQAAETTEQATEQVDDAKDGE